MKYVKGVLFQLRVHVKSTFLSKRYTKGCVVGPWGIELNRVPTRGFLLHSFSNEARMRQYPFNVKNDLITSQFKSNGLRIKK